MSPTARAFAVLCPILLVGLPAPASCPDGDGDGFGRGPSCTAPQDCEDRDALRNPSAAESCNGLDDDCDGLVDEGCDRICEAPRRWSPRSVFADAALEETDGGDLVRIPDGFLACSTMRQPDPPNEENLYLRRLDEYGRPIGVVYELTLPVEFDRKGRCLAAWSGRELGVLWVAGQVAQPDTTLRFQVYDRLGTPYRFAPLDLSLAPSVVDTPTLAWDGEAFAITWNEGTGDAITWLARVSPTDVEEIQARATLPVDDANGSAGLVWSADRFLYVIDRGDLSSAGPHVYPLDELGAPLGPGEDMTGSGGSPQSVDVARLGDGCAVVYNDARDSSADPFFARCDALGRRVDPPGEVELWDTPLAAGVPSISWSGEEFAVAWPEGSKQHLLLVTPDGVVQPPGRVDLSQAGANPAAVDIRHTGRHLVGAYSLEVGGGPAETFSAVVVCSCADGDGDQADTCLAQDCDDGDPATFPGAPESCSAGVDEDCDGWIDCDDPNCSASGGPPPEVTGVTVGADRTTISWDDAGADRYDVVRGYLSDLRRRGDTALVTCSALDVPQLAAQDDFPVPPGDGVFFLVRGESGICAQGSWGPGGRDAALALEPDRPCH